MEFPMLSAVLPLRQSAAPASIAMPYAPQVRLPDGSLATPQHYKLYQQNLNSVAELLSQISFDQHTLLFCDQDQQGMYLQTGLIGRENYEHGQRLRPHKLVYGRRWRIDSDMPDHEIVQTAFLAIKKAREHEVRELLTIHLPHSTRASAPLEQPSGHGTDANAGSFFTSATRDTPHAESSANRCTARTPAKPALCATPCAFTTCRATSQWRYVAGSAIGAAPLARHLEGDFPEFSDLQFSITVPGNAPHQLMYALMDALIQHSDRYVEQHFRVNGFARFSRDLDPQSIAALSLQSRPYARDMRDARFAAAFQQANFAVDAARAAPLGSGKLADINRRKLQQFPALSGHLPAGFSE
jgi:hypothetical protein